MISTTPEAVVYKSVKVVICLSRELKVTPVESRVFFGVVLSSGDEPGVTSPVSRPIQ